MQEVNNTHISKYRRTRIVEVKDVVEQGIPCLDRERI